MHSATETIWGATSPHLVMDDGADLIVALHNRPVDEAVLGDIFVTATGMAGDIRAEHFSTMKDGAILANSGHFDVEVDVAALRDMSRREVPIREHLTEFQLPNGRALPARNSAATASRRL